MDDDWGYPYFRKPPSTSWSYLLLLLKWNSPKSACWTGWISSWWNHHFLLLWPLSLLASSVFRHLVCFLNFPHRSIPIKITIDIPSKISTKTHIQRKNIMKIIKSPWKSPWKLYPTKNIIEIPQPITRFNHPVSTRPGLPELLRKSPEHQAPDLGAEEARRDLGAKRARARPTTWAGGWWEVSREKSGNEPRKVRIQHDLYPLKK